MNSIDMRATLAISDLEAQRGTQRTLTLPGGRRVNITIPPGAYDGQIIRLEGQGPPSDSGTSGALLIALAITPTNQMPAVSASDVTMLASPSNSSGRIAAVPHPGSPTSASNVTAATIPASLPGSNGRIAAVPQPGLSRVNIILLIVLAGLIIAGSIGFFSFYLATNKQVSNVNATATAFAQANANATATALAHITPQTNPTTNPTTPAATDPYIHAGTLSLNDPLQDNSQGNDWQTGINQNNATCSFTAGAYQSTQPINGDFHTCIALTTNFSNFVYEVQMTIVSGQAGGIIFRADQGKSTFYYFRVGQDGSYDLWAFVDSFIVHANHLAGGISQAIHTGANQFNIVAVVAQGASLALYVNHQLITTVNDSTYSSGQIGVVAYNQGSPAQVVFSNAKVWTL